MIKNIIAIGIVVIALMGCEEENNTNTDVDFNWNFNEDTDGWVGDFADYPVGEEIDYELTLRHDSLPSPLDGTKGAIVLSGTNMSDDLFMFAKTKISGLEPNTNYSTRFTVQFASDVPDGLVGVGGSPGESVFIKAGAVADEPVLQVDNMNYYRMNIDKGRQSQGGSDMVVLGDFSNDTEQEEYTLKTISNEDTFIVTSDSNGELWMIIGTDSGFEATTTIYYNNVKATFEKTQ